MTPALAVEFASELSQDNLWHEVAHEIRQPLSAIESIAYYLSIALPDDDKHSEHLVRVQQLVEQSNWILTNGLGISESRPAAPVAIDLEELLTQTISARPASLDPPVRFQFTPELPLVQLDPGYGRALIENILGLFRQLATETHPVVVRTASAPNAVELEIFTGAPGYRSVATLPPGSGLSLDCARRIAALHGGSCTYSIDAGSGIRVRVMLP